MHCSSIAAIVAVLLTTCSPPPRFVETPTTIVNNLMIVSVQLNGSAPMPFILDTGASTSVVDIGAAQRLGLKIGPVDEATTGGGSVEAAAVAGVRASIGRLVWDPLPLVAIDLSALRAGLGHPVNGILGYDVFTRHIVEIDYPAHAVRFHTPDVWTRPADAERVPFVMEDRIPLVDIRVRGNSNVERTARVEFDTGQTGTLTLTKPFVDESSLLPAAQPKQTITTGALLPGRVPAYVTRLSAIGIGRDQIGGPVVTVASEEGAGVSGSAVGLLGGEVLRRFDLFVDYSRRQVWIRPNRDFQMPLEFDMSGMSLAAAGDTLSSYRVRTVLPQSPAAVAGIMIDDVVTAIDGRPTSSVTLSELRQMLRVPDATHTLTLVRKGSARTISLRTRRLI